MMPRDTSAPDQIGTLHLRRILAVGPAGAPVLEGTNARVIVAGTVRADQAGRVAVCQDAQDEGGPLTVVLGLVAEPDPEESGATVIGNDAARIELHPDGHIRLFGSDVTADAAGNLRLVAGRIDLN